MVISSIGTRITAVAMPMVVLLITGSAARASIVAAFEVLPFIFLSLPIGVLVDRSSQRMLLTAASFVSLLGTAAIPVVYAVGTAFASFGCMPLGLAVTGFALDTLGGKRPFS